MKKRFGIIATLVLALVFIGSWATAAEKTGFVNVREVLTTSNAGKRANEDFKKLIEKNRAPLQERENELKKLMDELEKQRPLLKEEVLRDRELAFQKKHRDYQIAVEDSNKELQLRQQELSNSLVPEILKVIQAIGAREKYVMIIDIETPTLAYYDPGSDLTKRVIEEFNRTYKPPAGKK